MISEGQKTEYLVLAGIGEECMWEPGSLVIPGCEERNPEKEARVQDQGWVPQGSGRTLRGRMARCGGITCSWLPQQRSQLAKLGFQLHYLSTAFPKALEITGPQQVPISRWEQDCSYLPRWHAWNTGWSIAAGIRVLVPSQAGWRGCKRSLIGCL